MTFSVKAADPQITLIGRGAAGILPAHRRGELYECGEVRECGGRGAGGDACPEDVELRGDRGAAEACAYACGPAHKEADLPAHGDCRAASVAGRGDGERAGGDGWKAGVGAQRCASRENR